MNFEDFNLDDRLIRALQKMGFAQSTLIQEKVFQFAADSKDIIARAKTGSGKTLAYCLPILDKILKTEDRKTLKSIIFVPSRELAQQVTSVLERLTLYCSKSAVTANMCADDKQPLDIGYELPDILICTPGKFRRYLASVGNKFDLSSLQTLVFDEADLLFSFGYEDDLNAIISLIPRAFQAFLMSATLNDEVSAISKLFLRNPVTIKLEEGETEEVGKLVQYCINCTDDDRFLLLFMILKLKLVKGKCIIFVENIAKCYRVKLYLEQFSIKSCVLNSELPFNSRYHIVQEFNSGLYDYIIATDDSDNTKKSIDTDYGVSRGIDFLDVAAVINFDFPLTSKSYVHRAGRTARANNSGTVISFVTNKEKRVFSKIEYKQKAKNTPIMPYEFDKKYLDGFRYRCEDALRSVSKSSIQEARLKEIKAEIINSEKLKGHFAENPLDLQVLRHDNHLHPARIKNHLKHIPNYLLPPESRTAASKIPAKQITKRKHRTNINRSNMKKKKTINPLKNLSFNKL